MSDFVDLPAGVFRVGAHGGSFLLVQLLRASIVPSTLRPGDVMIPPLPCRLPTSFLGVGRQEEKVRFRGVDRGCLNGRNEGASSTEHKRLPAKSLAQISVASDSERASSTSTPRYRTVFSILLWPSRIWIARKLPVAL